MAHPVPTDVRKVITIEPDDYVIAVDQAVLACYKQRIKIDLAIGDFDSLKNQSMLNQLNVERLNPIKDVTDTNHALMRASAFNQPVYLIGGIGGDRIEHFYAHTLFFDAFPNLIILNERSMIKRLFVGSHTFSRTDDFISFFAYPRATITLSGFKYDLDRYTLSTYDPRCISNETLRDATIDVHEGSVLVIQTIRD